MEAFDRAGYRRFGTDARLLAWVRAARPLAERAARDPALRAQWLRHGGTWFVGVNALPNGHDGAVRDAGVPPLGGAAHDWISARADLSHAGYDRAQISVCYPGYPKRDPAETEAAHDYRRRRDAAHVDGLHPVGPDRRRKLREAHAFVLGIPLTRASARAAPFVVWEGSHRIMGPALAAALQGAEPARWHEVDLTDAYHAARRAVFDRCRRVELPAGPGEAYVIHRHALHGVAPWDGRARAEPAGRMIAYFRPEMAGGIAAWLDP